MKNSIPLVYAAITLTSFLYTQVVHAEDLLILTNKKEVRCTVKEFSGGLFTYEDASGKSLKIGPSALSKIKFDVPEESASTGTNKVVAAPTIEQVNVFPGNYVGQKLSFQECTIRQSLDPITGSTYFSLSIHSKGGEIISGGPGRDRIAFAVTKTMAEKMAPQLQGGEFWFNCTIKCSIEKMNILHSEVIVAIVSKIEVFNKGGKVGTTFTE
jgi:hypothetical protein